jgi:hypothetical protein
MALVRQGHILFAKKADA